MAQSRSTASNESAQQYTRGHGPNSLASKRSRLILAANRKSTLSLAVNKEATVQHKKHTQVMAQFNQQYGGYGLLKQQQGSHRSAQVHHTGHVPAAPNYRSSKDPRRQAKAAAANPRVDKESDLNFSLVKTLQNEV